MPCFVLYLTVTDLHQQGADHCVDSAHVGDGGHLVATQDVSLQGLCADLQIHLTCVHRYTVLLWKHGRIDYRCLSHCHILCTEAKQLPVSFSIQLIILPVPPSLHYVFPFLLLLPILFALINPHLLPYYTASPPYCSISNPLPSFLHSPQSFTQRTSTDHPPRERFLSVSSEILPDLLVQVIVSIPLRGS